MCTSCHRQIGFLLHALFKYFLFAHRQDFPLSIPFHVNFFLVVLPYWIRMDAVLGGCKKGGNYSSFLLCLCSLHYWGKYPLLHRLRFGAWVSKQKGERKGRSVRCIGACLILVYCMKCVCVRACMCARALPCKSAWPGSVLQANMGEHPHVGSCYTTWSNDEKMNATSHISSVQHHTLSTTQDLNLGSYFGFKSWSNCGLHKP